jgi:hypothetical protein
MSWGCYLKCCNYKLSVPDYASHGIGRGALAKSPKGLLPGSPRRAIRDEIVRATTLGKAVANKSAGGIKPANSNHDADGQPSV